ncbi:MAG: amino acid adenylation domain-containing protein [Pseudoflavonifractor sp.]|nr:amino acid adenylation domain-containing protein [Pseudoflavonifractor sp.]
MECIKKEEYDVFPLSLNQKNIWALEQSVGGTSINNISAAVRITGRVDLSLLEKALRTVVNLDPSLRTRITVRDGVPMQYHAAAAEDTVPLLDFASVNEESFGHWATAYTQIPIFTLDAPLYRFVLCRMGERSAGLLVETHHIISDGWSQIMLCNRIGEAYLGLLSGKAPEWEEFPDYAAYIQDEARYLSSKTYLDDQDYWSQILSNEGETASVKNLKSAVSQVGRRKSYRLSQQLNHAIYSFCQQHRVTPFSVFYMALATYLKRSGGGDRFTIGVPVFNRTNFIYKQTTGMFVSTLPFVNEVSDTWSFHTFSNRLTETWLETLRHQRFPFSRMEELCGGGGPLFRIMLSYQSSQILVNPDATVQISGLWYYSGFQVEQLCIHLTNLEDNRIYSVDYDYLTQMFSEREIDELHQYLCHILRAGLQSPDTPIRSLPILSSEERECVLYRFNQSCAVRSARTPYEVFEEVALQNPRRVAVIYEGVRTTYQQLKELGGRVAAALPEPGTLVAVLLPRDSRLFSALVGIMQANCAWLLLSPDQPVSRLQNILSASGASCLLSIPSLSQPLQVQGLRIVDIDTLSDVCTHACRGRPDDLAYVVYTSGSTGTPKGVEITQKSVVNLAMAMRSIYRGGAVLSLCNIGFDAFLLESVIALLCGRTVLLSNPRQQENPTELAQLIQNYGVGFLSTTPSRLSALLSDTGFALALRRLESIICGGEAFPSELLYRLRGYTSAHIYNQYGPSETTVAVSLCRLDRAERITIGRPMENCHLYVLDEELQPLPMRIYGELYVGGVCVGRGYRGDPELTAQRFLPSPFECGEILYKTGDIACWTADGELELAGRRDQQIKLRGLRVEPQEITACLCRHPEVTDATARALEQNGQIILVGYYVSPNPLSEMELLSYTAAYLPHYMIPARILRLEKIPLTPNGKVNERLLPEPSLEKTHLLPAGRRQEEILEIFRQVLNTGELYADSNYFLCGGNSLNAMETISRIEERFGVRLMISDLYACRTAKGLDEFLALETGEAREAPIEAAPACEFDPLTATQKSLYLQSCLDESGLAYQMPCAFTLSADPDFQRLEQAFRGLIADDPLFRTHFVPRDRDLAACVAEQVEFRLPLLSADSREEAFAQLLRPFDLSAAPLMRAALWKDPSGSWLLLVNIHHIISDGLSTPLLMERLSTLYRGGIPASHLSCRDYAWYYTRSDAPGHGENLAYWKEHLAGVPTLLELPPDRPRPQVFDFRGGTEAISFSAAATEAAEGLCTRYELTPYMLFAGALGILFGRLASQDDLVVGTPVSCRTRPELRNVCGPLMSTLPLRLLPRGTVEAYFRQVRISVTEMLDHGACPLEEILEALNVPRTTARNPLYQVMFQIRPLDPGAFRLGELALGYIPIPTGPSKLDLSIEAAKESGRYRFYFEYASSVLEQETVAFYGRCLEALVLQLAGAAEGTAIAALDPLSPADRLRCFARPWRMVYPYLDLPIHCAIEEETLFHPDADAVIWHGQKTSFAALNNDACRIAGVLAFHGVGPGDRVGLACRRSPDLLAAMLAILKTGGAYVPFLTDYPPKRIAYMMETADVKLILCDEASEAALPEEARVRPVVRMDEPAQPLERAFRPRGSETMYILFTSGSTGLPKGVQMPHRALSDRLQSLRQWMKGEQGPVLCIANATFDIFITETLLALAQGYAVVLADEEEMLLPWKLAELMTAHQPRIAQFTPSRLQMCLRNTAFSHAAGGLSFTIVAGEMVSPGLVTQFKSLCPGRLVNMYGPTETAVYVTAGELQDGEPITIGTPLNNCRIYVLDRDRKPVLPTAVGELYLAGPGLADGYAGRPDLTQELFLDDPFFPGERMYRSGDVGRLRLDGRIECLGRTDAQVKINGNRVELGEVVDALRGAGADEAAAIPRKNPDGSTSLYAVVTPHTLDPEALRQSLSLRLPSYMIPGRLLLLPQMPYNASGKLDMPALRALVERDLTETSEAPAPTPLAPPAGTPAAAIPVSEESLLEIWKQVLRQPALRADVSLFEQGGTSLSALSILSEYYNRHISMTLADFYRAPTVRAQAAFLGAHASPLPARAEPTVFQPTKVPRLRQRKEGPFSTVLLTGATGFLGAHLLRALLDRGCKKVICLLRDGNPERLLETLSWYFGNGWTALRKNRLEVCRGDVCQPDFGMSREDYANLAGQVNALYHAAADVRHYASDDRLLTTNLEGTRQAIAFSQKADAALFHISTASISGTLAGNDPTVSHLFTEEDLDIGQNWQDNLYIRSKFLAEQEICRAVESGLCARIFRIGRLIGRRSDGVFQKNPESNAFYRVVQGVRLVKALPESLASASVELSPVDLCAESIVALECADSTAFHVLQPSSAPLGQTLRALFPQLEILPDAAFSNRLSQASGEHAQALASLVDLWNSLQHGPGNVAVSCEKTHFLLREAGITWPRQDVGHALDLFGLDH